MSSSVGTDYGQENSTVWKRQQEEKAASQSGKTSTTDFLKLLTVQLQNQDPLSPMEDIDFTAQLAQLQALDEQMEMTKAMKAMRIDTQVQAGTNMMGKYISGTDSSGLNASGLVTRVVQSDDGVFVELANKQKVSISNVTNVWNDANSMNNDISSAGNVIGMWVEAGTNADGETIRGIVEKVMVTDGALQLKLYGGQVVNWSQVSEIRLPTEDESWYTLPDAVREQVEKAREMVNMTIDGTDSNGNKVTGMVAGAELEGSKVYLTLYTGERVELSTVTNDPREPSAEDAAKSLDGYYIAGLDEDGNDIEGIVVGAVEDDKGLAVILDSGERLYLDAVTGIRDAKDEDRARLHGMLATGVDTEGNEATGIIKEKLKVDGELAVKLDSGQIILCKNITSIGEAPDEGGDEEAAA